MQTLRAVVAVLLGIVIGSVVNMGLIHLGRLLVPPPPGVDTGTMEGLRAAMPLFGPQHFLFPFLAHALGTLVGALVALWVSPTRRALYAWIVGGFFLLGGIAAVAMLPAPVWFSALDLLLAYLPMAWLAAKIAARR
jgi:hypothetical protein